MGKDVKIVLTGGPCSGKTSTIEFLKRAFSKGSGCCQAKTFFIPETATSLFSIGLEYKEHLYWTTKTAFQQAVIETQLKIENEVHLYIQRYRKSFTDISTLTILDRGVLDGKAYCTDEEWEIVRPKNVGNELYLSYDLVIHLESLAKDCKHLYSSETNKFRTETPEEAINVDEKIYKAWSIHSDVIRVPSFNTPEEKYVRVMEIIQENYREIYEKKVDNGV